jgi:hypothetical protein
MNSPATKNATRAFECQKKSLKKATIQLKLKKKTKRRFAIEPIAFDQPFVCSRLVKRR